MWMKPKTDWQEGDYFNLEDYNRIKNNITCLHELALIMYPPFAIANMGADKTGYEEYMYADEFCRIEDNLKLILDGSYPFTAFSQKAYHPNQPFLSYEDLNRIESASLRIYERLEGQRAGRSRLAFTLGRRF